MQNDIIRKLREQLSQPITDEKTVVYVIVEIRKLMDLRQVPPGKYLTLRFYCNWAVHTVLSGEKAIEVLKLMDDALELKRKGPLTGEQDLYLQDIFGFHRFHSEICEFLAERGIDRPSFLPPENWVEFLKNYAEVIRDCPLVFKLTAARKRKHSLRT